MFTKTRFHKVELALSLLLLLLIFGSQQASSQTFCTQPGNERFAGEKDGYRYELWNQNGQGTACMTIGDGALFSGEWEGILNYLARRGLAYDQTKEHQEIGTFYAKYNCNYQPSSASGNSYLSVYGWTVNPLKEYYIVENWRNWIPSMAAGAKLKGTIESNGSLYDIYVNTRVNQPSIIGNTTFEQYFSIRRNVRDSGTINISDHFNKWESLGLEMGKMYEVSFVVEGYQSSGSFEFTDLDVYLDNSGVGVNSIPETKSPVRIYSDPNSGEITVAFATFHSNTTIKIYDILGNLILCRKNVNDDITRIPAVKSGIYLLNVTDNKMNYSTRLLVSSVI